MPIEFDIFKNSPGERNNGIFFQVDCSDCGTVLDMVSQSSFTAALDAAQIHDIATDHPIKIILGDSSDLATRCGKFWQTKAYQKPLDLTAPILYNPSHGNNGLNETAGGPQKDEGPGYGGSEKALRH